MNEDRKDVQQVIHHLLANKDKLRLPLSQIEEIMQIFDSVSKLTDKAILVELLSEQVLRHSNVSSVAVTRLMAEMMSYAKPERQRRPRAEGESRRRRPRRENAAEGAQVRDLDQLAEQSVSNPSNLEIQLQREADSQRGGLGSSRQDSNNTSDRNSRLSGQPETDPTFKDQLNRISEGYEMEQGTTFIHDDPNQEVVDPLEHESSNSSSQSFGLIANLSEKMELIESSQQGAEQNRERKPRRPRTEARQLEATMTKKKKHLIIDKHLSLEKTRPDLLDRSHSESQSMSIEDLASLEEFYTKRLHVQAVSGELEVELKKLRPFDLEGLIVFNQNEDSEASQNQFPTQDLHTDVEFAPHIDFTSQPTEDFARNQEEMPNMPSISNFFNFECTEAVGLESLALKTGRRIDEAFYDLLCGAQSNKVSLQQSHPEKYSEIFVKLLSQNDL